MKVLCGRCDRLRKVQKMQPVGINSDGQFIPLLGLFVCKDLTKCGETKRPAKMRA